VKGWLVNKLSGGEGSQLLAVRLNNCGETEKADSDMGRGEVTVFGLFEWESTCCITLLSQRESVLAAIRDGRCSFLNSLGNGFLMDVIDERKPKR
jgi:hypothetical protein